MLYCLCVKYFVGCEQMRYFDIKTIFYLYAIMETESDTVCPRSFDPFYTVTQNTKMCQDIFDIQYKKKYI